MPDISAFIEHFPYLGLVLLLTLGAFGFPFPEDATLILCGFLIATGVIKPLVALSVIYAVLLTTDYVIFWAGRKYGHRIITQKRFRKILSPDRLSRFENIFARWGVLFIILARHIAGLRAQVFLAAGIVRMPPLKFLGADAVTAPLTMAVMIGAGYLGGNSFQVLKNDVARIEHWVILLAIVLVVVYLFYTRLKR